jgi:hypothetical protein
VDESNDLDVPAWFRERVGGSRPRVRSGGRVQALHPQLGSSVREGITCVNYGRKLKTGNRRPALLTVVRDRRAILRCHPAHVTPHRCRVGSIDPPPIMPGSHGPASAQNQRDCGSSRANSTQRCCPRRESRLPTTAATRTNRCKRPGPEPLQTSSLVSRWLRRTPPSPLGTAVRGPNPRLRKDHSTGRTG